jgi:hypothetical protein
MSCCNQTQAVSAQNDIADILTRIIAFLQMIADLFAKKSQASVQTLGVCEQALVDEIKAELFGLLTRLPMPVQRYFQCKIGITPTPVQPQIIPGLGSLGALASLGDFAKYLPQILAFLKAVGPYLPQIMEFIKTITGGATPAPTSPTTPGAPLSPAADYSPTAVQRC